MNARDYEYRKALGIKPNRPLPKSLGSITRNAPLKRAQTVTAVAR